MKAVPKMDCGVIGEGPKKQAERIKSMSRHATQLLKDSQEVNSGLHVLGNLLMDRATTGDGKGLDEFQLEGVAQIILALNSSFSETATHHREAVENFSKYSEAQAAA